MLIKLIYFERIIKPIIKLCNFIIRSTCLLLNLEAASVYHLQSCSSAIFLNLNFSRYCHYMRIASMLSLPLGIFILLQFNVYSCSEVQTS